MLVVLMGSMTTSCGSDEETILATGTFTIGFEISERGSLTEEGAVLLNAAFSSLKQTVSGVSELAALTAFEAAYLAVNTSAFPTTTGNYTIEMYLKDANGKKLATHHFVVKDGVITKS